MTVCNEKGVFGLDNDEVVNSKKGYPRLFTTVEDNVVFGFDFSDFIIGLIIVTLSIEIFGDGDPRTDIIPIKGRFDIQNSGSLFHESVVNGDWRE